MSEESAETREKVPFSELTLAYWSLRLWIGLRLFLAGVDKFKGPDGYRMEYYGPKMNAIGGTITEHSFLPSWATQAFALPLGFALMIVGAMVLLGLFNRLSLFVGGLLFIGLAFGLMLLPDDEGSLYLGLHVGLVAAALALVRHNKLAITRW
ncbi:hypothetical protein BH23VER1_BH23VER1_10190 [soil metagenome]